MPRPTPSSQSSRAGGVLRLRIGIHALPRTSSNQPRERESVGASDVVAMLCAHIWGGRSRRVISAPTDASEAGFADAAAESDLAGHLVVAGEPKAARCDALLEYSLLALPHCWLFSALLSASTMISALFATFGALLASPTLPPHGALRAMGTVQRVTAPLMRVHQTAIPFRSLDNPENVIAAVRSVVDTVKSWEESEWGERTHGRRPLRLPNAFRTVAQPHTLLTLVLCATTLQAALARHH